MEENSALSANAWTLPHMQDLMLYVTGFVVYCWGRFQQEIHIFKGYL